MAKKFNDRDGSHYRSDGVDLLELGPEDGQELLEFDRASHPIGAVVDNPGVRLGGTI